MENFEPAIKKLHEIVANEYYIQKALADNKYQEHVEELIKFATSVNTQGLLSSEVIDALSKLYDQEHFRRIWGSISMNFEHWLKTNRTPAPGGEFSEFTYSVMSKIEVESRDAEIASLTNPQLILQRVSARTRLSALFTNPADFWLVCIIAFRLTLDQSEFFKKEVDNLVELASKNPAPVKKPKTKEVIEAK